MNSSHLNASFLVFWQAIVASTSIRRTTGSEHSSAISGLVDPAWGLN